MWLGLQSLKYLELGQNEIYAIQPNAFRSLSSLQQLDLSQNKLRKLNEGMWSGLQSLNILWLNGNNIKELPVSVFKSLRDLEELYLFNNKIASVKSDMWIGLDSLRVLWNYITTLPAGAFQGLGKLQYLSVAMNKLKEIRGNMWEGLKSLVQMNLGSNNINWIEPKGFSNVPQLRFLELQNNELNSFPANIFIVDDFPDSNGHPAQLQIDISRNPLHCDGEMCWVRKGEEDGWITYKSGYGVTTPQCTIYPSRLTYNVPHEFQWMDCLHLL